VLGSRRRGDAGSGPTRVYPLRAKLCRKRLVLLYISPSDVPRRSPPAPPLAASRSELYAAPQRTGASCCPRSAMTRYKCRSRSGGRRGRKRALRPPKPSLPRMSRGPVQPAQMLTNRLLLPSIEISEEPIMGMHKEELLREQEAMERSLRQAGAVCDICGQPAPRRHPKWGRLCTYHLNEMQKDERQGPD
jgi:hypothetical protein